jgi:hypothetical protein
MITRPITRGITSPIARGINAPPGFARRWLYLSGTWKLDLSQPIHFSDTVRL